ncbi:MAG: Acylaminoacyl-peptidase [Chloroflexi bacterium]|nr:Acylaminoacyl-peptidase [Chloroflexota bacterium]
MPQIESLLAARLFLTPQLFEDRIYFLSNLSVRLSLYMMSTGGSVPEPLLPPQIALQNPELIGGHVFWLYPELGRIVVMIDRDGDENYQPMVIPIDGGIPEPAFGDRFADYRVNMVHSDADANLAYFQAESRKEAVIETYQGNLADRSLEFMYSSPWGGWTTAVNDANTRAVLVEGYTVGDSIMRLWQKGSPEAKLLYGVPLEERAEGQQVPLTSFGPSSISPNGAGVICLNSIYDDSYGLGYIRLDQPQEIQPITVTGTQHVGAGEMASFEHVKGDRYLLGYNIDGCDWLYEGSFDESSLRVTLDRVLCGSGELHDGVLESARYDKTGDRYALAFSTATSPTQLYIIDGSDLRDITQPTRERILGLPSAQLSPGEDASYTSFDGQRISARLYLPAASLGFNGPRPLVYYIHGGPQGQERPNFAWFSMPLIQFLTLNGFAVFVPNVRGSTGYGLSYTKKVDRDWGGDDRLDHVHAMGLLRDDRRVDASRAAVVGRSYGGYMTLMLAGRHPELWSAAVDMFGPYDLTLFMSNIPETWKPYFALAVGDPETERDLLLERSPSTYLGNLACPMLVIQGKNDPRVVERESSAVVERLRRDGKQVEYLLFENEGHDVLKFENRVTCYNAITAFFTEHLRP